MKPVCKEIRREILKISKLNRQGHLPTCFSVVEIMYAVYSIMKHDPKNPSWDGRDIFILSKGHASLAQYCVLARFGYFDIQEVYTFGKFMSKFGCHADRTKTPGIEVSTGSLGHGIGVGVGIAFAFKLQQSDRKVFVVVGDGEANEGSVWEAVMVAAHLKLDNLTIIYDNNMSHARGLQVNNPVEKMKAFGCDVYEVDGHDVDRLKKAFAGPAESVKAIVAHTKKGYGSKTFLENHYAWHRRSPNDEELEQLLNELNCYEETV